jgi:hypothetical protein
LAACVPGYDACFVPASIVSEVRVLAVRADPPEALFDLSTGAVESVHVRALVAGHDRETRLQLRARLCAPNPANSCPDGTPVLVGPLTDKNVTEASLAVAVPASLIALARDQDPLKGYGGVRVLLELEAQADLDHAVATKTLLFSPRATTPKPNRGLELEAVELLREGVLDQHLTIGDTATLFVPISYGVRPRLAPQLDGSPALEEYDTVDLSGQAVHLREQATYSFYTEPQLIFGDLRVVAGNPGGSYSEGSDEATEPEGQPEPARGLVRITPLEAADAHLWVVVRDSRGAVAGLALRARSIDDRVCFRGEGAACAAGAQCCPALFFGCR